MKRVWIAIPILSVLGSGSASLAAPPPKENKPAGAAAAAAATTKTSCVAAHEQAQSLRSQKKLHGAREKFVTCARPECPVLLRKECGDQIEQMEAAAPTVALEALDDKGASDTNVKVMLDGQVAVERLTGAAIDVEPGEHVFRFERASDQKVIEQRVLVVEGEKNRKVVADFQTLKPPPVIADVAPEAGPKAEPKRVPVLGWVAGAVGVLGVGSFVFFSLTGKGAEHDLASSCAPSCDGDRVSPVKRDYLIGDVSLVVGIVGLVTAAILIIPALGASKTSARATAWRF